jgi:hypothetical protein
MPEKPNTRRRVALSCTNCRRSKIRCDRKLPCHGCLRSKYKTCVYDEAEGPPRRPGQPDYSTGPSRLHDESLPTSGPSTRIPLPGPDHARGLGGQSSWSGESSHSQKSLTSDEPSSQGGHTPTTDVESMAERIKVLESRLRQYALDSSAPENPRPPVPPAPTVTPKVEDVTKTYVTADIYSMSRGSMSKTRYFGKSHWINGVQTVRAVQGLGGGDDEKQTDSVLSANSGLIRSGNPLSTFLTGRCVTVIPK